ncbi:MAG: PH domain-containing protein [Rikenellaceae bacterium]|nr:PH domain-containing protein [Rikenellaceae bacterium]MCL2691862.1 PH domain-containing protein [Rikenellaceae bacterium]
MENQKVFRSRISILVLVFLLAAFISCTIPLIKHMPILSLCITGGVFVLIFFLFGRIRYIISGNKLHITFGGSVKISDMVSLERSYNPLSSPASSLKRLCLRYKKGTKYLFTLISPVREQEFIEDLKAINPDIRVRISDKKGIWRVWDWDI